ncbi:hypothetical protein [Bradyrhizobium sp. LB11.1]|jgi:hypothetical protein|uniref:hypothetical protein n=1 Tax=Bradyrhizobium sp. LB11.1 TaxID=3156326 RepID=UPI0033917ED5
MKYGLTFALSLTAFCAASTFAEARPPTVTNSPGYDARLQESRKALGNSQTAPELTTPPVTTPKRSKKKHPN